MQPKFGDDMQPKFSELMLHYFGDAHTINLIVGYSDISGMVRSYWRHYRFIKMDTIFTVLHHLKLTTGSHDHGIQLNPGDSYTILNQIDLDVGRTILHFTATNARPLRHIAFQIKMGMTVEIELAPCGYIKELTIKDSNRIQTDFVEDMSLIKARQSILVIDQAMQTNGNKLAFTFLPLFKGHGPPINYHMHAYSACCMVGFRVFKNRLIPLEKSLDLDSRSRSIALTKTPGPKFARYNTMINVHVAIRIESARNFCLKQPEKVFAFYYGSFEKSKSRGSIHYDCRPCRP
jgi:hypothetical protein